MGLADSRGLLIGSGVPVPAGPGQGVPEGQGRSGLGRTIGQKKEASLSASLITTCHVQRPRAASATSKAS